MCFVPVTVRAALSLVPFRFGRDVCSWLKSSKIRLRSSASFYAMNEITGPLLDEQKQTNLPDSDRRLP